MEFTRHENTGIRGEEYATQLTASATDKVKSFEQHPRSMTGALGTAEIAIGTWLTVDPRADRLETWEAVVLGMQISSAIFASAAAPPGTTVQCRIDHETHTIPATGPNSQAGPGTWLTAFWFALVCRDRARLTALAEIPLDLIRGSGVHMDEYAYHWVDSLQTYWLQRPGLAEKLTATFDNLSSENINFAPRHLINHTLYPPINLFYKFLSRNSQEFNDSLLEALGLWKEYWTDEEKIHSPIGLFPLGITGVTCLAKDAGIAVDVESGYLPYHLIHGSWLGEFPT